MKKATRSTMPIEGKKLAILFFVSFLLIYYFSSPPENTVYDYFTRLADALLHGKLYLSENPPWLNELIPGGDAKFFVPYPPMPAIILMPFRLILSDFPQQFIAHILGAGTVTLSVILSQTVFPKQKKTHVWIGFFVGLSTTLWFLSSVGSSWYLGQVSAAFFLTAALVSGLKNKPVATGIFLGAAYLSRVHLIFTLPLFVYILWDKNRNIKKIFNLIIALSPFVLTNFAYNLVRFGVIWDKGYLLIPGVLDEPWYDLGLVHPSYIIRHLKIIFMSFPVYKSEFPYVFPSWNGLALWITTPAIIFALLNSFKNKLVRAIWSVVTVTSLPILMHGTYGFAQFGYRFFIDLLPLFVLLLIYSLNKTSLKKVHWLLLLTGIVVNFWGVFWINKMGWVVL